MVKSLRQIVEDRLTVLGKNPFEAARSAGLERSYLNDILIGRKTNVRNDKIPALAKALGLDTAMLIAMLDGKSQASTSPASGAIPIPIVLAGFSSLLKRYLRTLGLSERDAELTAPVAAKALLEALINPHEPAQGLDQLQQIRADVDRLARQLLPKEH
jgi:transcriptional regulator with XRE-family HTH domain